MTDKQIKITIDDLINGNLRDMEITAQFGVYRQAVKGLAEQLKAKKQECERLENIINEAKNSKLDLKSFLVGEAVQNEYEQQLDQLKAENDKFKESQKLLEEQIAFNKSELELSLSSEIKRSELLLKEFKKADKQRDNWREKAEKLSKTLIGIKELLLKTPTDSQMHCVNAKSVILQKISEVINE